MRGCDVRQMGLFVLLVVVWLLLVWPPGLQDAVAGVVVALFVAWLLGREESAWGRVWTEPRRMGWFAAYIAVMAYYVVKANFDVAYRVLHPDMPINPGIVKVTTSLRSREALTVLANSITLTPGTLTVDASSAGDLYVHWINVKATGTEEATDLIVRKFEWFLTRVFE